MKELPKLRFFDPVPIPEFDKFLSPPTNYVQLLECIKHRRTMNQQEELVEDYTDKYHASHVAASAEVLCSLFEKQKSYRRRKQCTSGKFTPAKEAQFMKHLNRLEILVRHKLARFHPEAAASMLYSLARLHVLGLTSPTHRDTAQLLVGALCADGCRLLLGLGNSQIAAHAAYGGAVLVPEALQLRRALSVLCLEGITWDERATADHLTSLARGMAIWGARDPLLFDAIANHAKVVHNWFTPDDIALMMWAYARHRHRRDDMFDLLAEGFRMQLTMVTPRSLTLTIRACHRLGYAPPEFTKLLADKTLRSMREFRPRRASRALECLALMGAAPHPLFAAALRDTLTHRHLALPPHVIARVTHALALVGLSESEEGQLLMQRFKKSLVRRAHLAQPQHVANTFKAFAVSGVQMPEALDALNERASQLLPSFPPPALLTWLGAASRLGGLPLMVSLALSDAFKQGMAQSCRSGTVLVDVFAAVCGANMQRGNVDPDLAGVVVEQLQARGKPAPVKRLGSLLLGLAQMRGQALQQQWGEARERLLRDGGEPLRGLPVAQVVALTRATSLAGWLDESWLQPLTQLLGSFSKQELPAAVSADLSDAARLLVRQLGSSSPAVAGLAAQLGVKVVAAPAPPPKPAPPPPPPAKPTS